MSKPVRSFPLPAFQPLDSLTESTQLGSKLTQARNVLLRPVGGFKGVPTYFRLWATGSAETMQAFYRRQTFTGYPSGVGVDGTARSANKTCAYLITRQGKALLVFYDLVNDQCRGAFYVGDDGSYSSGEYDFTAGSPTVTVLAVGLDSAARWYGTRIFKALYLGNGIDDNVIVQLGRSATPGKWRKAGSNAAPTAPELTLIAPTGSANVQPFLVLPGITAVTYSVSTSFWTIPCCIDDATPLRWHDSASPPTPIEPAGGGTDGTTYYARDCSYNATTNVTTFKLAATPGGTAIPLVLDGSTPGAGTLRYKKTYGLKFTLKDSWLVGSAGNNTFKVEIIVSTHEVGYTSTLTGSGTTADPYIYTATVPATNTSDEVMSFINGDSKVLAFLSCTQFGGTGTDTMVLDVSSGAHLLTNGTGSGTSAGFSSRTVTFYSRYWDAGQENFGYEGVSSPISNELVIPSSANNDVRVLVPVNAAAEGGRFGYIRLYMQFEEAPNAAWLLINPDSPVPNGITGTFTRSSNEIVLAGTGWANLDVVRFTTTGTLPSGISTATDYYLRTGSTASKWLLSTTPDGATLSLTTAGTGTHTATLQKKCVIVGTQTPFLAAADGGEMFADQSRPLPHTLHAYSNEQVWRAGVTTYPVRIYVSKPATSDEVGPEGVSLDELSFISVLNQSQAGGTNQMTALVASQNRLDCHYATGITMFDPTNTDARNVTATGAGAINQTAVTVIEGKGAFILGGDMQLRSQNVEQTGAGFAAAVANSQFEALAAASTLRSKVDLAEVTRQPQRCFVFANTTDQHLYMSLPALDGTLKMFAFDFLSGGIVGEFDYPKVYAAATMEPARPEILFADEAGNLFVWDTANQNDHGDTFGSQAAFTPHSTTDAPPAQWNGYGYVDVGSNRYYPATTSVLETGFLDLAGADSRKALIALLFRVVQGSRALVTVTVTALDGSTESIFYSESELYDAVEHRLNLFLGRTTSIKIKFEVIGAEQKAWIIRDLAALWTSQGRV